MVESQLQIGARLIVLNAGTGDDDLDGTIEPVEHDALSVTYELLLIKIIGNTILRAHHKTTIGVSHVFYMLIHARVNLILKILLQAYVFLLILCLNHIFDPLNFDTTGIYFLCVKKVGRLATILSRLF